MTTNPLRETIMEAITDGPGLANAEEFANHVTSKIEAIASTFLAGTSVTAAVVVVLRELEDVINDDHDNAKTNPMYRPGLRRAARTIRRARRELEEDQT